MRKEAKKPLDIQEIVLLDEAGLPGNVLTVDVEEWYHVNYTSADWSRIDTSVSTVYDNTMYILEILAKTGSKATFFVLGCVAMKHPQLVRAIHREGHEVACHGDTHELVYNLSSDKFREGLRKAIETIGSQTGKRPVGFRAPSSSITEKNPWALDVICEEGFLYDSSIFPVKNYMYGVRNFPAHPCRITTRGGNRLLEIPTPMMEFGRLRIPFGGGFYLRVLPLMLQERFISMTRTRRRSFMLYFHPSDIDTKHIKIDLSPAERFFNNVGRRTARHKILTLLREYPWTSIASAFSAYL